MNDRIQNDWKDVERLEKLQQEYKNLKDKSLKTQMKAQVAEMEKSYQQWVGLRLKGIVRQYGGIPDDYALIPVETDVEGNTVLVGRTSPPRFLEEYREFEVSGPARRDSSICMRPSEMGIVDDVFVTEGEPEINSYYPRDLESLIIRYKK